MMAVNKLKEKVEASLKTFNYQKIVRQKYRTLVLIFHCLKNVCFIIKNRDKYQPRIEKLYS